MIKINFNLRVKLMLIFLLLVLVPLVTIGWFSLKTTEDLIVNMVIRQLQNVAVDKIVLLERWLDERKADLKVIAETSLLKSMDPDLITPYLDLIRNKYGVYKDLTVISASGDVISKSREGSDPVEQTDNASLYTVKESLFMSEITYIPEEKESTFHLAAPIFSDNGKLAGTIYCRVGTNKIVFFILNVSLGETGECYLVDKEGRFLAHKDPSRILKENISQTGSFKNIFQKRDGKKTYFDYRGIEVMGTSLKIRGTDWYIVVEQDREEAFHSVKNLKYIVYLTILLGIGSALMLTWMISYHMIRPIRVLSNYAGFIADSDFDKAVIKYKRNDEIGMLYRAFENMSFKLKERQNDLEQKVESKKAELKETDKILRKTKLIAERSEKFAAMGRMGAAVAHEIRTPITSLKLFLESVQDQIEHSAEDEEDFQIAMKQIKRIEATINRFLDLTKPQDLVLSEIDVRKLMEDVMLIIKPLATRQECSLNVRIYKNLPAITGDKKMLTEALINIFVNALEASPAQGKVTVTSTLDRFDLNKTAKPCIRIDISDTGHGIPEEPIENIFEPFFTTKAFGTGLGLPLVLNTIKSHGGVIRVKSKIEQGTTFSLFLPLEFKKP
ncbi:cache domain-containing protein [Thermodesulfobacteriota bacterium]